MQATRVARHDTGLTDGSVGPKPSLGIRQTPGVDGVAGLRLELVRVRTLVQPIEYGVDLILRVSSSNHPIGEL